MGGRFVRQLQELGLQSEAPRIQYENELVFRPDRQALHAYLAPLLEDIIERFDLQGAERKKALKALQGEIPKAADLYVGNRMHEQARYPFSVYYTWFAKETLETRRKKRPV